VSDCDRRFVSDFWQELHKLLGTRLYMSTAYHPQSDGFTERSNRTLIECLCCVLMDKGGAWTDLLSGVEFAINNSESTATGMTPFFMTYGRHPRMPATLDATHTHVPEVTTLLERIQNALQCGRDAAAKAQIRMTQQLDASRRPSTFKVGDMVYLSTRNIHLDADVSHKFSNRFIGPLRILELLAHGNAAKLETSPEFTSRGIHLVFNVGILKKWTPRPSHLGSTPVAQPPPIDVAPDGNSIYKIHSIIRQGLRGRGSKRCLHVLVRWEGYGNLMTSSTLTALRLSKFLKTLTVPRCLTLLLDADAPCHVQLELIDSFFCFIKL
jgi:hypothetical protein